MKKLCGRGDPGIQRIKLPRPTSPSGNWKKTRLTDGYSVETANCLTLKFIQLYVHASAHFMFGAYSIH